MSRRDEIEGNLREHLNQIAIPRHGFKNSQNHKQVSEYIRNTLRTVGASVQEHLFSFEGERFSNWIATDPSDPKDLPLLIAGAHFDSMPDCPGADDNASGTAVLLETLRLYLEQRKSAPPSAACSVQFVFFDLEECNLIGSKAYAGWLQNQKRAVKGMYSVEMVGTLRKEPHSQKYPPGLAPFYPSSGDFIGLIGSLRNPFFWWKTRQGFRSVPDLKSHGILLPGRGTLIPDVRLSDHAPFWDAGYPAILITDTSFFRNPHYHTAQDTTEKLDVPFMAAITEALLKTVISF